MGARATHIYEIERQNEELQNRLAVALDAVAEPAGLKDAIIKLGARCDAFIDRVAEGEKQMMPGIPLPAHRQALLQGRNRFDGALAILDRSAPVNIEPEAVEQCEKAALEGDEVRQS